MTRRRAGDGLRHAGHAGRRRAAYYTHIRRGRPPTARAARRPRGRYDAIGGISPLRQRTEAQRGRLAGRARRRAPGRFVRARAEARRAVHRGRRGRAGQARRRRHRRARARAALRRGSVGEYLERVRHRRRRPGRAVGPRSRAGTCCPSSSTSWPPRWPTGLADLPERHQGAVHRPQPSRAGPRRRPVPRPAADLGRGGRPALGLDRWAGWGIGVAERRPHPRAVAGPDILEVIDDLAEHRPGRRAAGVPPRVRVRPPRGALRPRHRGQAAGRGPRAWPSPAPRAQRRPRRARRARRPGGRGAPRPSPRRPRGRGRRGRHHRPGRGVRAGRPPTAMADVVVLEARDRHRRQDPHDPVRRPAGRRRRRRVPGPASRRRRPWPARSGWWTAGVTRPRGTPWSSVDGALRPLPARRCSACPTDLDAVAPARGFSPPAAIGRAALDPGPPLAADQDVAIGPLVRDRLGDEVLDRLVDPLVGGINAGDPDRLSVRATTPQLAEAAGPPASLIEGARSGRAAGDRRAPCSSACPTGMGELVDAVAGRLPADQDRERPSRRSSRGPRPLAGSSRRADADDDARSRSTASCVTVSAVRRRRPAPRRSRPSRGRCSPASSTPRSCSSPWPSRPTTSAARSTRQRLPRADEPSRRLLTACSWTSSKWAHLGRGAERPGHPAALGRPSRRRPGDRARRRRASSPELLADLEQLHRRRRGSVEVRVNRWPRSFPQYAVGHLDRVAAIESALARYGAGPDRGRRRLPRARRSRLHRAGPHRPPGRRSPRWPQREPDRRTCPRIRTWPRGAGRAPSPPGC